MRILFFSLLLFASNVLEANSEWRLEKDEEGIKVYLRDTAGNPVKSFKGTMMVDGSLSSIISVIDDTPSYTRWLYNCRSAKNIKRISDTQTVNYVVTDMPWPVVDRDLIVLSKLAQDPATKRVEIKLQAAPKILAKVANMVRIEKMHGRWLLTPTAKNKINIIYEMNIDPGGNIPKWLINSMAVDLPFNTLQKLRNIIKEDKYASAKIKGVID